MEKVMIINGPNLNLLGSRNPAVYGVETLKSLEEKLLNAGERLRLNIECRQTNEEGIIINWLQEAHFQGYMGVVLNAGAYTHYSYAIRDCIEAINIPVIEVHLSNIYAREEFRHHSCLAPVTAGQISGLGFHGYELAIMAILHIKGREINGEN